MSLESTARPPRYRIRKVCGLELPRVGDGRSSASRTFRRAVEAYAQEVGGQPTPAQKETILQLATLSVRQARQRQDILEGRDVDEDAVIRMGSERRRLEDALRARSTTNQASDPVAELKAYLASKAESGAA